MARVLYRSASGGRPPVTVPPVDYAPVDPNLIQAGKNVLSYMNGLKDRTDKRLISGQYHLDHCQTVANETGKWPAMMSEWIIYPQAGATWPRYQGNQYRQQFLNYWTAGGLCSVHGAFSNPKTKGVLNDTNFNAPDFTSAVTEDGNIINENYRTELDLLITDLLWLQDRGVPIILRLLFEQAQGGFWYGARNSDLNLNVTLYQNLYRYTLNYIKSKGVHNCMYAFAGTIFQGSGHPAGYSSQMYPGNAYVDICGIDMYKSLGSGTWTTNDVAESKALLGVAPDKIHGYCEYGQQVAASPGEHSDYTKLLTLKTLFPRGVYWMSWSSVWSMRASDNPGVPQLFADPWVVTRDELPKF